jgi:L-serine dehydratase
MNMEYTMSELLKAAQGTSIGLAAREAQAREDGIAPEDLSRHMIRYLHVMRDSVKDGLDPELRSVSGMAGGQAARLYAQLKRGSSLCGGIVGKAAAYALAVAECNACMGKIVAAPTAGACGILPAALLAVQEEKNLNDEAVADALFTAAAIGRVIAQEATISGAEGGCQAESGSAAAMTAAALVELMGGTPMMAADACSFALMNTMGLVCDPVGGLVEVPCVYRNVGGIGNAFTSADMALSGITCPIPPDEVILAMKDVGDAMPASLRETGEGGCAACPSMRARFVK